MQIYDVLASAQDGRAVENLARAADVDPTQLDVALRAVVPEFTAAFERNTLSRGGLADFVKAIGDSHHEYILDHPEALADPRVRDDGNAILENVFGSRDRSRGVAMRAANASGLGDGLIKMLLPYIAQMVMGAIAKWAKGGLGDVVRKLPGGGQTGSGFPMPGPGEPTGGGRFDLPQSDVPQGGFPMPPMPDTVPSGSQPDGRRDGGFGIPWPRQGNDNRDIGRNSGGQSPFPFPFPLPGEPDQPNTRDTGGGFRLPWPGSEPQREPMRRTPSPGGGGFGLPRSEMPPGGYPMPPIPGGTGAGGSNSPYPLPLPGGSGQQPGSPLPLPMPPGDNPYGDLSDILRRGGSVPGVGGGLGSVVRTILGGLLGFGGRGVIGWLVRFLVMRFGWGLLRRVLGRALTGR